MSDEPKVARLLWEVDLDGFGGNELLVADVNGDGEPEILARQSPGQLRSELNRDRGWNTDEERRLHCITAVDLRGNVLWRVGEPQRGGDPYCGHGEHDFRAADLDGDGRLEIAYSGSRDFFVASMDGEVIWRRPHRHSQKTAAGRFRKDVDGLTLILTEKWIGITCYTPGGDALWSRACVGDAFHVVRGWRKDGLDLVVFEPRLKKQNDEVPYESAPGETRSLWPYLMDGEGLPRVVFPWKETYLQPKQHIRAPRGYDHGIGFRAQVLDVDGDGRDEAVVWDRRRAMAFGAP